MTISRCLKTDESEIKLGFTSIVKASCVYPCARSSHTSDLVWHGAVCGSKDSPHQGGSSPSGCNVSLRPQGSCLGRAERACKLTCPFIPQIPFIFDTQNRYSQFYIPFLFHHTCGLLRHSEHPIALNGMEKGRLGEPWAYLPSGSIKSPNIFFCLSHSFSDCIQRQLHLGRENACLVPRLLFAEYSEALRSGPSILNLDHGAQGLTGELQVSV